MEPPPRPPLPLERPPARLTPAAALLLLVLALLFHPALRGEVFVAWDYVGSNLLPFAEGKTPDGRHGLLVDSAVQWHPFNLFYNEALHRGRFPLRDPWNRFGNPTVAPTWPSALYPPKILLNLLLPAGPAHNLLIVLHLFAAGLGMALLLRGFGASSAGCALGALAWAFAGPVVAWAELEFGAVAAAHAPLTLHFIRRAFDERAPAPAALAGLTLGHLLLGCHLQFALYVTLAALLATAWHAGESRRRLRPRTPDGPESPLSSPARFVVAIFGVAALVAAPTLLPALALTRANERVEVGWGEEYMFAQAHRRPLLALTFLNPALFGDPDGSTSYHSFFGTNANDFQGFAGTAPFALALAALLFGGGRTGLFRLLAALSLAAAFVPAAYAPFYYLMPGGKRLCASRILFLFAFAVSALAGLSLERASAARPGRGFSRLVALTLAAGVLLPLLAWAGATIFEPQVRAALQAAVAGRQDPDGRLAAKADAIADHYLGPASRLLLHGAAAFIALLALLSPLRLHARPLLVGATAVELLLSATSFLPHAPGAAIYPPNPVIEYLRRDPALGRVALDGAGGSFMPDTLKPYGIHDLGGKGPLYPAAVGERLARLAGKAFQSHVALDDFSSPLLAASGVTHVLSPRDAPPGYPERLERCIDAPAGRTRIFRVKGAKPLAEFLPAGGGEPAPLRLDLADPNVAAVDLPPGPGGRLVVRLHAAPGTRAFVDGAETPLSLEDGFFLGCAIRPGARRAEFRFAEPLLAPGFVLAAAGLLLAAMCVIGGRRLNSAERPLENPKFS